MRLLVMERDKFTCRSCYSKTDTLNVHHSFYRKGASPWEYDLGTLITFCEPCHLLAERRRNLILANTVRPIVQKVVLDFAVSLSLVPGPFPRHFEMILTEVHSMMLASEEIDSTNDTDEMDHAIEGFKANVMEAQAWMFAALRTFEDRKRQMYSQSKPIQSAPVSLDDLIASAPDEPESQEEEE